MSINRLSSGRVDQQPANIFDSVKQLLLNHTNMSSISDKLDNYFYDYSLTPLYVQVNLAKCICWAQQWTHFLM